MANPGFRIDEITLVLAVAVVAIAVSVYSKLSEPDGTEAEKLTAVILGHSLTVSANGGIVDENKLREIKKMNYNEFKKSLNIEKDFCIYIEDEKGGILLAKGSSKLKEDGINCSE